MRKRRIMGHPGRDVVVAAVLLMACEANPRWTLLEESEHFRYFVELNASPPCAHPLAAMEAHFAREQSILKFAWAAGRKIDYLLFKSFAELDAYGHCGAGYLGCSGDGDVESALPFHRHELIHAYLEREGWPHRLYQEGIAQLESCSHEIASPLPIDRQTAFAIAGGQFQNADEVTRARVYDAAAFLAREIVDRFGEDALMRLYRTSSPSSDPAVIETEFRSALSADLDEVWTAAMSRHFPDGPNLCDCTGPVVPTDGTDWLPPEEGCANIPVFEVAESTGVAVEGSLRAGMLIQVQPRPCRGDGDALGAVADGLGDRPRGTVIGSLSAGTYFLENPVPVRITTGPLLGVRCNDLQPYPVVGAEQASIVIAPPRAGISYARLLIDGDFSPTPFWTAQAGNTVQICSGCDDATCAPLAAGPDGGQPLHLGGTVTFRFTPGQPGQAGFDNLALAAY